MDPENLKESNPTEYERRRRVILEEIKAKHNIVLPKRSSVDVRQSATDEQISSRGIKSVGKSGGILSPKSGGSLSPKSVSSLSPKSVSSLSPKNSGAKLKPVSGTKVKSVKEAQEKAAKEAQEKAAKEAQLIKEKEERLKDRMLRKADFIRRVAEEEKAREEAKKVTSNPVKSSPCVSVVTNSQCDLSHVDHAAEQKRAAARKFELLEERVLLQQKGIDMEASRLAAERKQKERAAKKEAARKLAALSRQQKCEKEILEKKSLKQVQHDSIANTPNKRHTRQTERHHGNARGGNINVIKSLMQPKNVFILTLLIVVLMSIVWRNFFQK